MLSSRLRPLHPTKASLSSSSTVPLPPPTPLPSHPASSRNGQTTLSVAATTFALRSYFEIFLLNLGWDPASTPVSSFVTQYAWLLGDELGLPPAAAQALFLEIFDATTPTMLEAATAIVGIREKLGCSEQVAAGVARLWRKNQGLSPQCAVADWGGGDEQGMAKVEVGVLRRRRKRAGWMSVVKIAMKRMCGGEKGDADGTQKVEWRERHGQNEKVGDEVHGRR